MWSYLSSYAKSYSAVASQLCIDGWQLAGRSARIGVVELGAGCWRFGLAG
jgi:hypothetical protein